MSLEGDSDGEGAPRKTHDSNVVSKMRNSLIRRVGGGVRRRGEGGVRRTERVLAGAAICASVT